MPVSRRSRRSDGRRDVDQDWEAAVRRGDGQEIRRRLAAGADANLRDRYGQTGLMLAAHAGHADVVETLAAAGADLNITAKYGLTALMLAIVAGHADIARLLVAAGADVDVRGSGAPGFAGKSAYDLARARGLEDLVPVLRRT
jgi:uncharacterized protein